MLLVYNVEYYPVAYQCMFFILLFILMRINLFIWACWISLPYGLTARIAGFHPAGPGSTPGMGIFFEKKGLLFFQVPAKKYMIFSTVSFCKQRHLSTGSRVIPSCQGDSIIFHNEKFLQLQGILITHPPKGDKKRELTQHIQ